MKLRTAVLAFSSVFLLSYSFANEPISVSSVPFQSVDYWSGLNSQIVFYSVRMADERWDVSVPVDLVEVVLSENQTTYTTLNLVNAHKEYGSIDWLRAKKAVVVVRQKNDFILWQKFLTRVRKQQEFERKKWAEPKRVLPPVIE